MKTILKYIARTNLLAALCLAILYAPVYLFSLQDRFHSPAQVTVSCVFMTSFLLSSVLSLMLAYSLHYARTAVVKNGTAWFETGKESTYGTILVAFAGFIMAFYSSQDSWPVHCINILYGFMLFASLSYIHISSFNKACKQILSTVSQSVQLEQHPRPEND